MNLTNIGKQLKVTKYYFSEIDILCAPVKIIKTIIIDSLTKQKISEKIKVIDIPSLMVNINFIYNQIARLDNRISEMIESIPEWNENKWNNIIAQRDQRQNEFEKLMIAYNKKYENL